MSISRRDFLKVSGLVLGGVAATVAGIEVGNDPHFINALKVTKELAEARISGDQDRIFRSQKLAMVWVFAETTAKYSEEMGLGGAGLTMEHYLYGNGEPLDISFLFEKVVATDPEFLVGNLISSSVNEAEDQIGPHISPKKDYQFTNRALKELTSESGLKSALDARVWSDNGWPELFNAFGGGKI
ncbi:MAG: twin-arginine translocation signal domain-containing protein [Candidatus Shapirobacteria bacterium]